MPTYGSEKINEPSIQISASQLQAAGFSFSLWRLVLVIASIMLLWNGIDGIKTEAESSTSLFAKTIQHRGGQSLAFGVAIFGVALMPFGQAKP